jgi:trigger factor
LNITLEKTDATNASLKVKLEESDYRPKVGEKLKEYSRKAVVKGFRPGKVPATLIQKMYGKGILVDEINNLLVKSVNDYIKENNLNLVGEPLPNVEKSSDIDWDNQKEFEFSYSLGLAPEFNVDLSDQVKVAAYEIQLSDKEVNETIENLQKQYHRHEHPETSAEGDSLAGELKQKDGDFNAPATISLNQLNAEARPQFLDLSKGSQVNFDLKQAFPDAAIIAAVTGLPEEQAAELSGEFEFTLNEITRHSPAPLDQEFFDRILGKDAVTTEEEFLTKVRGIISDNYQRESDAMLQKDIQETLLNQHAFELPDEFLKRWLLTSNEGKVTEEQVENEYDMYARELRWNLIKNRIAEENDIKVEHEDVQAKTKELIRQQFGFPEGDEAMEGTVNNFADSFLKAEKGKNYMNIFNQVFADKINALVKSKITIEKKPVDVEEFKKIAGA